MLVGQLERRLERLENPPQRIILSYHGVPQQYLDKGDPYHCQCVVTTRLVREAWPHNDIPIEHTFQSRFGPKKWLEPYTDRVLEQLPKENCYRIMIATPGFVSDCVETLEEIGIEARASFRAEGGDHMERVACANDSPEHIRLLEQLVRPHLKV
jgi:ferrochelatase